MKFKDNYFYKIYKETQGEYKCAKEIRGLDYGIMSGYVVYEYNWDMAMYKILKVLTSSEYSDGDITIEIVPINGKKYKFENDLDAALDLLKDKRLEDLKELYYTDVDEFSECKNNFFINSKYKKVRYVTEYYDDNEMEDFFYHFDD